jgi:tetratricopeptide (TPR) repeat protein
MADQGAVAKPVMNRWVVVIGAIVIQLCLGAIYAWSVFTKKITDHGLDEAVIQYQKALDLTCDPVTLLIVAGDSALRQGADERALDYYRLALARNPDWGGLADSVELRDQGEGSNLKALLEAHIKALSAAPAATTQESGLEPVLAYGPDHPLEHRDRIAAYLLVTGDAQTAKDSYDKALHAYRLLFDLEPDWSAVTEQLAGSGAEVGRLEERSRAALAELRELADVRHEVTSARPAPSKWNDSSSSTGS